MADARGFLKYGREKTHYRPVAERLHDYKSVQEDFSREKTKEQAARCMDCGIPFCNNGCPLGNIIPDFNDLVFRDKWEDALARLHSTNNFPEFTGMVCPAPCEQACVLGINQEPVTISHSTCLIATGSWLMPSTQAASHGAGQMRPVNSGKLLVECSTSSAFCQSPS